ncbi:MAG TPA: hypothetical protein VFS21_15130 [Roseiflexaceae bacterium]|nr:hypothetical protein [Roseiflexaceae bacterium]
MPPAPAPIETPWLQQFYVYSVVLTLFTVVWLADGLFTVLGLVSLGLPVTVFGLALAVGFHLLASWGQRTLIFDPLPLLKLFGVALLSANVLSNVVGIRLALSTTAPALVGTLPLHPVEWLTGIGSWFGQLITGQEAIMPPWWPTAVILVLLAGLLAWQAERQLAEVHGRWRAIYQQRPQ